MKTYACKNAIDNSSPTIAKITIKGKTCIKLKIPPADNIVQAKPARIFNKQWPDIILANNRKANETTRKLYETTSITTSNGANASGAPAGKNKDSIWKPCVLIPITLIPKKAKIANPKVTTIWLVTVKLKGIIPTRLQKNMNEKILKRTGKYRGPFFLTFSDNTVK